MIDIEKYKPKPLKYRKIFKKHGITVGTIANYLGLSYGVIQNIFSGIFRLTEENKKKLDLLVEQLESNHQGA